MEWNLTQQRLIQYQTKSFDGTSVLLAKSTKEGLTLGIPENQMHVSLWGPTKNPAQLIKSIEAFARENQMQKLLWGADEFHFLPGVPSEQTELISVLQKNNYVTMEVADLAGNCGQYEVQELINSISIGDYDFELIDNQIEKIKMIDFLKTEFPGRWLREFLIWDQRLDTKRALWFGLKKDRKFVGFARIGVRKNFLPTDQGWTMGALRFPPGAENVFSDSDGCLGPIGVAESERGKGSGKVLLGLALQELRSRNTKQICIDWTNAFKYYERLNFKRVRNYQGAWKQL